MRLRARSALVAAALAAALGTQVGLATSSSAAPSADPSVAVSAPGRENARTATPTTRVSDDMRRTVAPATSKAITQSIVAPDYPVLAIPVYFSASASSNATKSEAADLLAQAQSWYTTVSGGRLHLQPTVVDPVQIDNVCAGSDDDDALAKLTAAAKAAARSKGLNPSAYAATVIFHPDCGFGWEGIATWTMSAGVSTHTVLVDGPDGRAKNVVVHELGHTLRLEHANLALCYNTARYLTAYVNSSSECGGYEYEDTYDTMGNYPAAGGFSGANLSALGWLGSGQQVTRSSGTTSTRLTTLETGAGVRVIKVRASATVTYWIEYRRRVGVDAGIPSAGVGVQVRRTVRTADHDESTEYFPPTEYLDMAPDSMDLNVLRSGSSWTAPEGVKIYVGTQSSSAAWVKVRFRAPKPQKPSTPTVKLAGGVKSITATWTAPADHGRPVGSYRLYVFDAAGRRVKTVDLASTEVLQTRTATVSSLTSGQRYTVKVKAVNDYGYSDAATANATVR